jgi:hypothetical protein
MLILLGALMSMGATVIGLVALGIILAIAGRIRQTTNRSNSKHNH